MKKIVIIFTTIILIVIIFSSLYSTENKSVKTNPMIKKLLKNSSYIIIAWNEFGMHCSNKNFANLCILPPYNRHLAHVIKIGDASTLPEVLTTGYHVTYEIPGNTYSVGKTDFWTYVQTLFGVALPNNIGLTGLGLTGNMTDTNNLFFADGIPITPFPDNDLVNEHPYQLTLIKVYDAANTLLATTQTVIPVSNEMSCVSSGCHSSEQGILNQHPTVSGFDPNSKPIFCSNCHQDNSLGKPGVAGIPSLSLAVHGKHSSETNDCYKCHPGPNAQCLRDVMKADGMVCQDCHGSVANVALTIENGRDPWNEVPRCSDAGCHGAAFAPEPGKLFSRSKGHGNLSCSTCHGSPHAILPSLQPNDNAQNINLQGYAGTLNKCVVCHGVNPSGPGPHGIFASNLNSYPAYNDADGLINIYPNPVAESATILFNLGNKNKVNLALYNSNGQQVKLYVDQLMAAGSYTVNFTTDGMAKGVYYCILKVGKLSYTKKIVVIN